MRGIVVPQYHHPIYSARNAQCPQHIYHGIRKLSATACMPFQYIRSQMRPCREKSRIPISRLPQRIHQQLGGSLGIICLISLSEFIQNRAIALINFFAPERKRLIPYSIRQYIFAESIKINMLSPRLLPPDFECPFYMIDQKSGIHRHNVPLISQLIYRKFSICSFQGINQLLHMPGIRK